MDDLNDPSWPATVVEFEETGLHRVSVSGELITLWGTTLEIDGTFEIWVAEPLDVNLGTFEGTPLAVGDSWSPVVHIEPGVPAAVVVDITHYPNGDAGAAETFHGEGMANAFGYFTSDETWAPTSHGEYTVSVTASYTDPADGTLWMGTRSGASIVATPNTPLIAHGQRDVNIGEQTGDLFARTWYIARSLIGDASTFAPVGAAYPFFRGDVIWLEDRSPISPTITLEDPTGLLDSLAPELANAEACRGLASCDSRKLNGRTGEGLGVHHRPDAVDYHAYWYSSSMRADGHVFHAAASDADAAPTHIQWYGADTYNCQIGTACFSSFRSDATDERNGDEEGDVKLLFGGAVVRDGTDAHFVPYASMAVLIKNPVGGVLRDPLGTRLCPPYQGAAGGLGTCGSLLVHDGHEVDLFVTPTGVRPGDILEVGDDFVFSGQAWPTLDVKARITLTMPTGATRVVRDRANAVGYIDGSSNRIQMTEPGIYTVHVSLTQDRVVPSTGLAPDPAIVADGRTTLTEHGYTEPLSAILGSPDSTYRFFVAAPDVTDTLETVVEPDGSSIDAIDLTIVAPPDTDEFSYILRGPGLVVAERLDVESGRARISLDQAALDARGFSHIIVGLDELQLTILRRVGERWLGSTVSLRGMWPLGTAPGRMR